MLKKEYKIGTVLVKKYQVDYDNIEESVAERLLDLSQVDGRFYVNPEYTVRASDDTSKDEFLKQSQRALGLWNSRLAKILGSANRKKLYRKASAVEKNLKFTGVQVINGKVLGPKFWNS